MPREWSSTLPDRKARSLLEAGSDVPRGARDLRSARWRESNVVKVERAPDVVRLTFEVGKWTLWTVPFKVSHERFSPDRTPLGVNEWPELDMSAEVADGRYYSSIPCDTNVPVLSEHNGTIRYVSNRFDRHFIDLRGDMETYASKFSSKTRATFRRKIRKYAAANGGNVDWREYKTAAELEEFYPMARDVSRLSYQERLMRAGLPETPKFRQNMLDLARRGDVRAYLLFLSERPVAYLFMPADGDRLIYQHLGYDPNHRQLSPGTVLQWLVLEHLFEHDRFAHFDFTEGEGPHKSQFGTHSLPCANVFFLRATTRARSRIALHRTLTGGMRVAGRELDRWGVKHTVRNFLRARA